MSLAIFENFLNFAETAVAARSDLPAAVDAAEFESALVSYGVVLLHSHIEQCLRGAIEARCVRCVDLEVRAFAMSVRDEKSGKIGIEALKGTLKRFSIPKVAFHTDIKDFGGADSWESVMNQRGTVAHQGQPATCSLGDLRIYYNDIRKILGFFCNRLGLDSSEVTSISSLIVQAAPPAAGASAGAVPP
jgi:hypothetical protein